jgi:hypothetical protein
LYAAGDDEILRSAHDTLCRKVHGLLGRTALTVDGRTGNMLGHPGDEPCCAGDIAGLAADRVDTAVNNVINKRRVDIDASEQFGNWGCTEVSGMHV